MLGQTWISFTLSQWFLFLFSKPASLVIWEFNCMKLFGKMWTIYAINHFYWKLYTIYAI